MTTRPERPTTTPADVRELLFNACACTTTLALMWLAMGLS